MSIEKKTPTNVELVTSVDGIRDLVVWLQTTETSYIIGKKDIKDLTEYIKFLQSVLEGRDDQC